MDAKKRRETAPPHRPQSPVGLDEDRKSTRARHSPRDTPRRKVVRNVTRLHHPNARHRPIPTSRRHPASRFTISSKDLFTRVERKTSKSAQNVALWREKSPTRGARVARDQNATAKKGRARKTTFYDDAQFLNTLADSFFVLSTNARLRNENTHNIQKKKATR